MRKTNREINVDVSPLVCKLRELSKIVIKKVDKIEDEEIWDYLVSEYHYLGYKNMFGKRIKYLVLSGERIIAALSFNQGTNKLKARDLYIQWSKENREKNLNVIINNNRFLILPWIKVKFLASHILSLAGRQVELDWKKYYGTKILLLETFVDNSKYQGTCYLAANWKYIGNSSGYSRVRDGSYIYHGNQKGIYLYSLRKDFRKILKCEEKSSRRVSRKHYGEEVFAMLSHQIFWEPKLLEKLGIVAENVANLKEKFIEYYSIYRSSYNYVNQIQLGAIYLQGLINNGIERKSIEPIAMKLLGSKGVRPLQQYITTSPWKDATMRDVYQKRLSDRVSDSEDGMISVDESDFVKKGKNSAGVMRQYCGTIGKVDSCQAGIFIGYAGKNGYGLINGKLYTPERWMDENHADLRLKCKFPEDVKYKDKCSIFLDLLSDARMSGYFPAKWIGCDSTFGTNHKLRETLNKMGYYYFANIRFNMNIWPSMPEMRAANRKDKDGNPIEEWPTSKPISVYDFVIQDTSLWNEVVMGEGSKGPIISYIKTFRVYENIDGFPGREVWLYVRKFENGELKFAFCNAPADTLLEKLDKVALLRWSIEQCFEECKTELGMAHYEVRSYNGWHRHMLPVMVAHEFLCEVQNMFKKNFNTKITMTT